MQSVFSLNPSCKALCIIRMLSFTSQADIGQQEQLAEESTLQAAASGTYLQALVELSLTHFQLQNIAPPCQWAIWPALTGHFNFWFWVSLSNLPLKTVMYCITGQPSITQSLGSVLNFKFSGFIFPRQMSCSIIIIEQRYCEVNPSYVQYYSMYQ